MRLILDARTLLIPLDSISRYSLGVIKGLSGLKPNWKLSVIVNPLAVPHLEALPVETIVCSAMRFRRGENRELIPIIESSEANCYLNFSMAGPSPSIPTLLSVHDLMVLNVPGHFGNNLFRNILGRFLFRKRIKRSVEHARAISVLSEAALIDLQNAFPGAET